MTKAIDAFTVQAHGGIDPWGESPKLVGQHMSAYHYVAPHTRAATILEIGHGHGYGSFFMAEEAKQVISIDLFEHNVKAAQERYQSDNLQYRAMNATDLSLDANQFDIVCSFQVIEHIPRKYLPRYISEIKRVLKPGGKAYITTLNLKRNQKKGQPYDKSPHHDKEFTPSDFKEFLEPKFSNVEIHGLFESTTLKTMERLKKIGLLNFLPQSMNPVTKFYQQISFHDFSWQTGRNLHHCIDLMGVLTK